MAERQEEVLLLPDDVLAVCRRVCRAWRALVDDRRLLRADLLPHSLAGIFIHYDGLPYSNFLARPSPAKYHLPCTSACDHCNGLVLQYEGVLNPATGGWTPMPEPPRPLVPGTDRFLDEMYLAFDPAVSPHYEVFVVPIVPRWLGQKGDDKEYPGNAEWPPSPLNLSVFSSRTGQWEERSFVRENEAAGTAAGMVPERFRGKREAVCWRGALYVHCQMDFIMRISLSDDTYRVIKPPRDLNMSEYTELHLGKSEKGIYSALLEGEDHHLRVWLLDESGDQTKVDTEA